MPVFGENLGERRIISEADPSEIRYAWFSKKMCLADCGEVALYEMEDGKVKEITCVSLTAEHGCGQDDMQFVGKTTTSGYRGRKLAILVADLEFLHVSPKYFYHSGEILTE